MSEENVVQFPVPKSGMTILEKERARVQILMAYLDKTDPFWRRKILSTIREYEEQ